MLGSHFQDNLKLFESKSPHLVHTLQFLNASHLETLVMHDGEMNIKDMRLSPPRYVYPEKDHRKEQKIFWESIIKEQPKVIYIFGLGLGHLFVEAQEWLKEQRDHYLVFLEPDLHIIKKFLETPTASILLNHPQVRIEHVQLDPRQPNHAVELCVRLSYAFFGLKDHLAVLPFYAHTLAPMIAWFKEMFDDIRRNSHYHVIAHLFMAERNYRNIYENLFSLASARYFQSFHGACSGIPAIIVGAGPSIQKNIHLLKELSKNALIFAGGAAITMLGNNQLVPDLAAVVDPDPPFERFAAHKAFATPLLFQMRASRQIISLFDGPKLFLPPTGGIPLETWLLEQLQLDPHVFGTVLTISDVCTRVAALMGCSPIIFVGMDLCYTSGRYYAESVSKSEDYQLARDRIDLLDIHGNPVSTKSEWKLSATQIALIAKEFPAQKFINATEGGIGFEGIPNLTLQETKEIFLQKELDSKGQIHALIQNTTPIPISETAIQRLLTQLSMSLQTVIVHCGSWQESLKQWSQKSEVIPSYEEEFYDQLIEKEIAYQVIIKPQWDIFHAITERNVAEAEREQSPQQKRLLRELHKQDFCKKTAFLHLKIIRDSIA